MKTIISFHFKFEQWVQRLEVELNDELFKELKSYGRLDLLMGLIEHVKQKFGYSNGILDSYNKLELLTEKILTIEKQDYNILCDWLSCKIRQEHIQYEKTQLGTFNLINLKL